MRTRILFYVLAFLAAVVLQTTLAHTLAIKGVSPDLIVLFVTWFAMREGALAGIGAGFFAGLFFDVYSPQLLGAGSLAKCLIGFGAGLLDERTLKLDEKYRITLIFVAALLHDLILYSWAFDLRTAFQTAFLVRILPGALYTTLAGGLLILADSRRN